MPKTRTSKNICLHCFGTLDGSRVCLSCKRKADDTPPPAHHLPSRVILAEKYLIDKALGEGGFGITYLAWDITLGIKVAIKEYFPSGYVNRMPRSNQVIINSKQNQAASNRGLKRFIDEAKMLAKIKNLPGIVSVRDFFSANGTAYIVMEFLDGISLKKYLQRKGGKIPCDEILTILRPVMESLVQVHKLGLIHRDISPDNILITKNNEVKLIDFGAAKQSNLDGKSLSIVLKQGFAPEEQYRTHGEQGPWTDIYALGVTVYYAITGTLPPESIQRLYKDTIIRPSEKGAVISPTQESALMKSLAVFAQHRYRDVTQMMNGLYGLRRNRTDLTPSSSAPLLSTPARRTVDRQGLNASESSTTRTRTNSLTANRTATQRTTGAAASNARTPHSPTITPRATGTLSRTTRSDLSRTSAPSDPSAANGDAATKRAASDASRVSSAQASYGSTTSDAKTAPTPPRTSAPLRETEKTDPPATGRTAEQTERKPGSGYERKLTLFEKLFGKRKK